MNKENAMRSRKRNKPSFNLKSKGKKRRRVSFAANTTIHEFDSSSKAPLRSIDPSKFQPPRRSSMKKKSSEPNKPVVFPNFDDEDEGDDMRLTVSHPNEIQNPLRTSLNVSSKTRDSEQIQQQQPNSIIREMEEDFKSQNEVSNSLIQDDNLSVFLGRKSTISRSSDMSNTVMLPSIQSGGGGFDFDKDEGDRRESDMRLTLTGDDDNNLQAKTPSPKKRFSILQNQPLRNSTVILDDLTANEEDNTETMTPQIKRITQRLAGRSPALQKALRTTSLPLRFGIDFVQPDPSDPKQAMTTSEFIKELGIPDLGGLEIFRTSTGSSEKTELFVFGDDEDEILPPPSRKRDEESDDDDMMNDEDEDDDDNTFSRRPKAVDQLYKRLRSVYLHGSDQKVIEKHLDFLTEQNKEALASKTRNTIRYDQNNPSSFLTLHKIMNSPSLMDGGDHDNNTRNMFNRFSMGNVNSNRRVTTSNSREAKKNRFFRFMKRAKNQVTAKSRLDSIEQENRLLDDLIENRKKSVQSLQEDHNKILERHSEVKKRIAEVQKQLSDLHHSKTEEILSLDNEIEQLKTTHKKNNVSEQRNRELRNEVIFYQKMFMQCGWKRDPQTGRFLLIFDQVGLTFEIDVQFIETLNNNNNGSSSSTTTREVLRMYCRNSHCSVHDGNEEIRKKLMESCQFQTKICDHVHSFDQLSEAMIIIHQKINSIDTVCKILYRELYRKRDIFYTIVEHQDIMRKLAGLEIPPPNYHQQQILKQQQQQQQQTQQMSMGGPGFTQPQKQQQQQPRVMKEPMILVPIEISIRTKKNSFRIFLPLDSNYPRTNFEKFGLLVTRGSVEREEVSRIIRQVPDDDYMRIPMICDEFQKQL